MKLKIAVLVIMAAAATSLSCTNRQGESEAAVFISVSQTGVSPFGFSVIDPSPAGNPAAIPACETPSCPVQIATIQLASHFKSANATDPQHFSDVNFTEYDVVWTRTDGGTKVPPVGRFPVSVLVPSGGSASLTTPPILPAGALLLSPFDQLQPSGGGIDHETGQPKMDFKYQITFFGEDMAGHRVQSDTMTGFAEFFLTL
jgi:hypothetical protein